jgi:serine/threonine protein kinase
MPSVRHAQAEPIPGYRLLERLGKGGFGEVWKCEAPGGLFKAVKFVRGPNSNHVVDVNGPSVEQELHALEHIRSIRHPFLLSMDRIEIVGGELIIVMELADQSLHDYFKQCQEAGLPGVPRQDLLNDLQEAAEALDLINIRHGLQHLDIKPRNLLLVSRHVKVADFGLVSRLAEAASAARKLAAISPIYAAPEVFRGTFSPASDQYSLAMTYHELLTGELPFCGKNFRQFAVAHLQSEPDLHALPEADRPAVARALAKDPAARFPSCSDFIQALMTVNLPGGTVSPSARLRWQGEAPAVSATVPRAGEDTSMHKPLPTFSDLGDDSSFPERVVGLRNLTASPVALSVYQFQECLDRGELSELWMAEAPAVGPCFVRFLYGLSDFDPAERAVAVQHMSALSHPALVPSAVVRSDPARLVLVAPRLGTTLREHWLKATGDGSPGVPRAELLRYLHDVAVALDALAQQYGVLHLSLSPDIVQLAEGRALLADHGLAPLFWLPAGQPIAAGNARYAAPELWGNAASRQCDSYSLAIIYQEMLTGKHPFAAAGRQLQYHVQAKPDLSPLPEGDRAVLQRALDRTPGRRFATCAGLIAALEAMPQAAPDKPTTATDLRDSDADFDFSLSPVSQLVRDISAAASNGGVIQEHGAFRYLLRSGHSVHHNFIARVPPHALPLLLEPFARQWHAQQFEQSDETIAYRLTLPGQSKASLTERPQGLEVHVCCRTRPTLPPDLAEVRVRVTPFGASALAADHLLRQTGPAVLESVRGLLQAHPERRVQDRLPYEELLTVWPLDDEGVEQMPIRAQGKDLSRDGLGLYLPCAPPSNDLRLFLALHGKPVPVPVQVRVVHTKMRGDRVEVGTMFVFSLAAAG